MIKAAEMNSSGKINFVFMMISKCSGPDASHEVRPIDHQMPETVGAQGKAVSCLVKDLFGGKGIIYRCGAAKRDTPAFRDSDRDATAPRHREAGGNRRSVQHRSE